MRMDSTDPRLALPTDFYPEASRKWNEGLITEDDFEQQVALEINKLVSSGTLLTGTVISSGTLPPTAPDGVIVLGGTDWPNAFYFGTTGVFMEGRYHVMRNYGALSHPKKDSSLIRNIVDLGTPPSSVNGERYDLVFLEIYEVVRKVGDPLRVDNNADGQVLTKLTAPRKVYEWRIRTQLGINFANPMTDTKVKAMDVTGVRTSYGFTQGQEGIFYAGDGSTNAKSILGTLDGYTRAIPLFRVYRRNSAPYNATTNVFGAVPYLATTLAKATTAADTTLTLTNAAGLSQGYKLKLSTGGVVTVDSVSLSTNEVTLTAAVGTILPNGSVVTTFSDRPDSKYSNVIYSDDLAVLASTASMSSELLKRLNVSIKAVLPTDTSIGSVTPTEISYLQGVGSNIQNQLNGIVGVNNVQNTTLNDHGTLLTSQSNSINALLARLNTGVSSILSLSPGIQTYVSDRDKPFNLTSIKGRMLLNLLGKFGNFFSTSGWSFASCSGSINTDNAMYGSSALTVSLSAATGRVTRTINTVAGRYYVVAVDVKMGNASGGYCYVTGVGNGNTVNSGSYQTTFMRLTATASTTTVGVAITGSNGQIAYIDGFRVFEISNTDYIVTAGLNPATARAKYPFCEGLAGVKNPYAIRWTDSSRSQLSGILAFDTELRADPSTQDTGADTETLYVGNDGQYYKRSFWNRLTLDGTVPWVFAQSWTGYKAVAWQDVPNYPVSDTGYVSKYDKTLLSRWAAGGSATSADSHVLDGGTSDLWITISSADSGWGDSYTPNANEMKAYFLGWKMYDTSISTDGSSTYNRTDGAYKAWARRTNGIDSSAGYAEGTYVLPTVMATNFNPYELMYRKTTSELVPVATEGAITLTQGDNIIEVGSGLIIREYTKPLLYPGSFDRYMINYTSGGGSTNPFLYNPSAVLEVYENGRKTAINTGTTNDKVTWKNGIYVDRIDGYSSEKVYSVSYFLAELYPTAVILGTVLDNERAIIGDLGKDIEQITRRVSAMELRKLEKDSSPAWITPTLLSTWASDSNNPFGYRKKDGMVQFIGVILNGSTSNGTLVFRLPEGYRPKQEVHTPCYAYQISDGSFGIVEIIVKVNGDVVIGLGGKTYLSLAPITFSTY